MKLSNYDFITAVFANPPEQAVPWVTGFDEDPNKANGAQWGGVPMVNGVPRCVTDTRNNFMAISTFKPGSDGRIHRRKANFAACHLIMVDDVGTKIQAWEIALEPSYKLETSPGNYQYGYILDLPVTDGALVARVIDAMVAQGLATDGKDPGMKGVTRYGRLPIGRNTKAKYVEQLGGLPFVQQLEEWDPDRRFTLSQIIEEFELDLSRVKGAATAQGDDPILKALEAKGLIKGPIAGKPGVWEIVCPWLNEHTDGVDNGAAYFAPGYNGYVKPGFKCHHGHCESRNIKDLLGFLGLGKTEAVIPDEFDPENVIARFNKIYAVCLHGTSAAIATVGDQGEYVFYQEKSLEKLHRGELVAIEDDDKVKYLAAFPWWTRQKERRQHGHVVFEPDNSIYRPGFPEKLRTSSLNLWRGLQIAPKPGDHDLITEHIFDVFADRNEARYEYIIDWLAAKFQHPGVKVRTCLVFKGSQGDGKNTFWELALVPILGTGSRLITNPQHVTGRFNAALRGTVLVLLNEAFWGGGRDYEGILKSLITDPVFMLEQKGIDPVEIPNYLDLIMFTNAEWPVRVGAGDRRFYITETSPIHRGDVVYFDRLHKEITDETRAAFLHMLLTRDVSNFKPERFPDEHDLKLNAKINSLEPHERFLVEFITDMKFGTSTPLTEHLLILPSLSGEDLARSDIEWAEKGIDLDKDSLYELYLDYIKERSLGRAVANNTFYRSLWKMSGQAGKSKRPRTGERQRVVALNTRAVCQKALETYLCTGRADL